MLLCRNYLQECFITKVSFFKVLGFARRTERLEKFVDLTLANLYHTLNYVGIVVFAVFCGHYLRKIG